MQFRKKSKKKIIAVALVALMMTSSTGITMSLADTVAETETIIENTEDEKIIDGDTHKDDKKQEGESQGKLDFPNGEDSDKNGKGEETVEEAENIPEGDIGEESLAEFEDLNNAQKTSARYFTGFSKEDGKWYFYSNGQRKKGWVDYKGVKYYILNTYQLPQNMWRLIKGHKYYFNKDGVMIRDQKMTIDGKVYQFNEEGHLIANDNKMQVGIIPAKQKEIYQKGEQILIEASNTPKTGVMNVGGKWYKYENGKKTRGWFKDGNKTYYFLNTFNRAENMWRKINGKLYYFASNGEMYNNAIKYIDNQTYKFNADGSLDEKAATTFTTRAISIRTTPDTSSKVLGKLQKGNGVEVLGKSGNFSKVRTGDERITGWIPSDSILQLRQEKIQAVIAVAKSKLGSPYVWGATGPNTFDCSGLMLYSFRKGAGINLPRVSRQQARAGRYVSRSELREGDLIFWGNPIHHVALYIGNGKYIHAPQPGDHVRIANLGNYTTARRIIE